MNNQRPGWIKLHRRLQDWEWYDDHNATRLLIHLLITVNHKPKKWKGITIQPGQIITSWDKLSTEIFLTKRQCRTAMDKLISSNEVTKQMTGVGQRITLVKWEELQQNDLELTGNVSTKSQLDDSSMTTTKEYKEYKEVKENNVVRKSDDENPSDIYDKLAQEIKAGGHDTRRESLAKNLGVPTDDLGKLFVRFEDYQTAMDKKHKTTIELWRHFVNWANKQKIMNQLID